MLNVSGSCSCCCSCSFSCGGFSIGCRCNDCCSNSFFLSCINLPASSITAALVNTAHTVTLRMAKCGLIEKIESELSRLQTIRPHSCFTSAFTAATIVLSGLSRSSGMSLLPLVALQDIHCCHICLLVGRHIKVM